MIASFIRPALYSLVLATVASAAPAAARSAEDVMADLKHLASASTTEPAQTTAQKRAELLTELYALPGDDPVAARFLGDRWRMMIASHSPDLQKEIDEAMGAAKSNSIAAEAYVAKINTTLFAIIKNDPTDKAHSYLALKPIVEAFAQRTPDSVYLSGAYDLLANAAPDHPTEADLLRKAVATAKAPNDLQTASASLKNVEGLDKPFDLAFNDTMTGKKIDIHDLKGKVVVIDFWATWCGPCVAEMPTMKKLYAEYKNKGVEFIGVSLDLPEAEGGLDNLKKYLAANEILWPQYYQGKSWDGDFSSSHGVIGVPTVFIVDQAGKLISNDARGKLETMLPALLGTPTTQRTK